MGILIRRTLSMQFGLSSDRSRPAFFATWPFRPITEVEGLMFTTSRLVYDFDPPYSHLSTENMMRDSEKIFCKICLVPHDEEIHAATVSIHGWFREQV